MAKEYCRLDYMTPYFQLDDVDWSQVNKPDNDIMKDVNYAPYYIKDEPLIEHIDLGLANTEVNAGTTVTDTSHIIANNTNTNTNTYTSSNQQLTSNKQNISNTTQVNQDTQNINNSSAQTISNLLSSTNLNQSQNLSDTKTGQAIKNLQNCGPNISFDSASAIVNKINSLIIDKSIKSTTNAAQNILVEGEGNVLQDVALKAVINTVGPSISDSCISKAYNDLTTTSTNTAIKSESTSGSTLAGTSAQSGNNTTTAQSNNTSGTTNLDTSKNSASGSSSQSTGTTTGVTNSATQGTTVDNTGGGTDWTSYLLWGLVIIAIIGIIGGGFYYFSQKNKEQTAGSVALLEHLVGLYSKNNI